MRWKNLGLIYKVENNSEWQTTHAMVPTPLLLKDRIRAFYSSRNQKGKSHIGYVDLDRDKPTKIIKYCDKPIIAPGRLGTFDDCGVTNISFVDLGDKIYMYYIGWNQMVTTAYRNTIGLAISDDRGETFERYSIAPIIERTKDEPYFCTSPWVIKEKDIWHMWYACVTEWLPVNNKPEPIYHIKYAHSTNGIDWHRDNVNCIPKLVETEANARPTVIKVDDIYKMWFCYRGSFDFRDGAESYKIGYAESKDGKNWNRKDHLLKLENLEWDSKMQAYPAVLSVEDKFYLFYNGNGFGVKGFGCAQLES